ncbi:PIN-like domain-containing protein [Pseudoalteromonas piscicida]|uniref:PIN-like domain-containing protein n=1 Tax=Pseudoalteromonas piscicida TaxID=43662 RepID=UPI000698A924|nr:PIN-like domain-containing protein [Pseudoalteromonas piscicida]
MKEEFKGFYSVSDESLADLWSSENTLFVFDTNVLLNLYGYAIQTRDDFFKILESVDKKIWIPYHVGLEYQRNRLTVIKSEKKVFNEIEDYLKKISDVFKNDFTKLVLEKRFPKLYENTNKLEGDVEKAISHYRKSVAHWNKEQPCVRSHDSIRAKLNILFENKVGPKPESQEWLDNLYIEGGERYKKKIPPGFKDLSKENKNESDFFSDGLRYEKRYGDLILWKQLINKANEEHIENVIFVTDDSKEDWWYQLNSNGIKVVGPLAELQAEIYRESNIKNFHMYNTSSFLKDGKKNSEIEVSDSSIEDAKVSHIDIDRFHANINIGHKKDIDLQHGNASKVFFSPFSELSNELSNEFEKFSKQDKPSKDYRGVIRAWRDMQEREECEKIYEQDNSSEKYDELVKIWRDLKEQEEYKKRMETHQEKMKTWSDVLREHNYLSQRFKYDNDD